jgi:hypothetical protein
VRVSLQVLFMSNILTASGNMISSEVLSPKPRGEARSTMRWPNEQPTTSDMDLWRNAMRAICPSWCLSRGVGWFVRQTHCIWKWYSNSEASTLHRTNDDRTLDDVFVAGRKPNCFHFSHSQHHGQLDSVCSVQPTLEGDHWRLLSTTQTAAVAPLSLQHSSRSLNRGVILGCGKTCPYWGERNGYTTPSATCCSWL